MSLFFQFRDRQFKRWYSGKSSTCRKKFFMFAMFGLWPLRCSSSISQCWTVNLTSKRDGFSKQGRCCLLFVTYYWIYVGKDLEICLVKWNWVKKMTIIKKSLAFIVQISCQNVSRLRRYFLFYTWWIIRLKSYYIIWRCFFSFSIFFC